MSPVYYALAEYGEFYWVSSPEATYSRNLATRPEVTLVIFDSRAPVGTAQAVYVSAVAEELIGADLDRGYTTPKAPLKNPSRQGGRDHNTNVLKKHR